MIWAIPSRCAWGRATASSIADNFCFIMACASCKYRRGGGGFSKRGNLIQLFPSLKVLNEDMACHHVPRTSSLLVHGLQFLWADFETHEELMKCTWSFDVYEMIRLKNAHRILDLWTAPSYISHKEQRTGCCRSKECVNRITGRVLEWLVPLTHCGQYHSICTCFCCFNNR
jgi:hypothetical protein